MFKLNKILIGAITILLLVFGAVIYWQKVGFERSYWAVYLNTGDIYFGKLSLFPRFSLSDVWFLQRNADDAQNYLSIAKFDDAFWGPQDKIYINEKNIIWKTKLREDGQVFGFIRSSESSLAAPTQ